MSKSNYNSDVIFVDKDKVVKQLNKEFFIAPINGQVPIVREVIESLSRKRKIEFLSEADFKRLLANQSTRNDGDLIPIATWWLKHKDRRQYSGIVFDPSHQSKSCYNLFRGFENVTPQEGDCSLFLQFVREVICNGDEVAYNYLLDYLAHMIQKPAELPGVAIVLYGEEGVGKGVFVDQIGALVHPYYLHITVSNALTDRFNDILQGNILVFADETGVAGNKVAVNKLKGMITERELLIEAKYVRRYQIANFMRLIIASNDEHVVDVSPTDRRYFVLQVSSNRRGDSEYFGKLVAFMKAGGRAALMHYLCKRDISTVNLRVIPETSALREQKTRSMSAPRKWWYDRLCAGELPLGNSGWPELIAKSEVFDDYVEHSQRIGEMKRADETRHGLFMKEVLREHFLYCKGTVNGKRVNCYRLPDLKTCRKLFEKVMNMSIEWPQEE